MTADILHHPAPVLDCKETVRRLWDYLDRELSDDDMAAVDAHLAACTHCPPHFTFERQFLAALKEARSQHGASSGLRARVRAALEQGSGGMPDAGGVRE